MNKSKFSYKDATISFMSLLALIVLWLFLNERAKNKRKNEIIDRLKNDNFNLKQNYLALFEQIIIAQNNVEPSVLAELQKLKSEFDGLDQSIHIELDSVIKRVNAGEHAKGVKDLAKIVEYSLKNKASKDETFKNKPMLHNLLEHAHNCKWITPRQFQNGLLLKEIRNKESHELAVEEQEFNIGLAIFAGIDILYTISNIQNT